MPLIHAHTHEHKGKNKDVLYEGIEIESEESLVYFFPEIKIMPDSIRSSYQCGVYLLEGLFPKLLTAVDRFCAPPLESRSGYFSWLL